MHQDEAVGVDLRKEAFDLLLANRHIGVREKKIDGAIDLHLEAGLIEELNPWLERGRFEAFFCAGIDDWVELAADDLAEAVSLQTLCDPFGGDAEKRAGLNNQPRLDSRHQRRKELENLEFGSHRIDHAPLLGMGALWGGAVRLGLKCTGGAIMLEHDLVFLL